jgi:hypothetical protein
VEPRHGPVVGDTQRDGGVEILLKLAPVSWALAALAAGVLVAYAAHEGEDGPLKFVALVFAGCGLLWVFPFSGRRGRRSLISLFLLAFAVRVGSAMLFDSLSRSGGDPYGGSPDAWAYDQWARRLVSAWSELRGLNLHAYDAAGRWDVGFHYVLAAVYALFGPSLLLGRVLVGFFGALAVVFLFLVARRVAGGSVALIAGILYTLWISSIVWSTSAVLRDSLVWALSLLAVWLALRVVDSVSVAGLEFFLVLLFLRTIRPYSATLVVLGLAIAGAFALLQRDRAALRPAVILATAVLAGEAVFFAAGFPNAVSMTIAYQPGRVLLRPVAGAERSKPSGYRRPPQRNWPEFGAKIDGELETEQPRHLLPPSLPANALRFFVSPPGWAPVPGGLRRSDNWPLPGMWPWYAILPVSALGLFLSLRGSRALRTLATAALLLSVVLVVVGRGDSARQREMLVPLFLLWFAVGLGPALRRPGRLLAVYLVYAAILGGGILYHRRTLRERGMVQLELPAAGGGWMVTSGLNTGILEFGENGRNSLPPAERRLA